METDLIIHIYLDCPICWIYMKSAVDAFVIRKYLPFLSCLCGHVSQRERKYNEVIKRKKSMKMHVEAHVVSEICFSWLLD